MHDFAEVIATNPQRLVVMFQRGVGGQEEFQWGVVGAIPILSLVGYITRVQTELVIHEPLKHSRCPDSALVIVYDNGCKWFIHPDIPVDSLVGMLEMVKASLIASRMAQQLAATQTRIVGPNGQPLPKRLVM